MSDTSIPQGRRTQTTPAIAEMDILWLTAGLSCDGDTVSITAATQPSIEGILLGGLPGLPKVNLRNPMLARENGEEFLSYYRRAAEGESEPFIPRRRRLYPQREDQEQRLLGCVRNGPGDRRAHTDLCVDRPAGAAGVGRGGRQHLFFLRRHPRHSRQSDWLHRPARLPRRSNLARFDAFRPAMCIGPD